MNRIWKQIAGWLVLVLCSAVPAFAQIAYEAPFTKVAGRFVAVNYNWRSQIVQGASAGVTTIIMAAPQALPDGASVPIAVASPYQPMTFDVAPNSETITPTSVSITQCPQGGVTTYNCYAVSGTFANAHGVSAPVVSGTVGLQEAITRATGQGGGIVVVDTAWVQAGGSDTIVSAAVPLNGNVTIEDTTGPTPDWWTPQPSTLSALATPATRSATAGTTQVISGTAVGTWAASTYHVCITYVDMLGGESACSADFSFTATASVALNYAAPAASTGAVGWRAYGGVSYAAAYQLPITSSNCTLTTAESVIPACSMASAGVFLGPVTTTALRPGYTVATYNPVTQSHTTFGYIESSRPPSSCSPQSNFGPFTATAGGTTTQKQVLGTVNLVPGCLNWIGKTIRISGKIAMTNGTSETPQYLVQLGPTFTTGTPTNICTMTDTTALTAAANSAEFTCTMTTNATGATGTIMPGGFALTQLDAGTTAGAAAVESATAAITDNLTGASTTLYVTYIGSGGTSTAVQLLDLHIEDL